MIETVKTETQDKEGTAICLRQGTRIFTGMNHHFITIGTNLTTRIIVAEEVVDTLEVIATISCIYL